MHELTHIYDFEKYLQHHKCRDKERETRTLPNYHGFFAYTEFHASFCSEFFYAKYLTFLWEKDVEAIARPEFISSLDQYIAIKKQEISDGIEITHTLQQLLIDENWTINKFDTIANNLVNDSVESIQLAPNGVVTDIYPEEENEAGKIDLLNDKERGKISCYARDDHILITRGPFELK